MKKDIQSKIHILDLLPHRAVILLELILYYSIRKPFIELEPLRCELDMSMKEIQECISSLDQYNLIVLESLPSNEWDPYFKAYWPRVTAAGHMVLREYQERLAHRT